MSGRTGIALTSLCLTCLVPPSSSAAETDSPAVFDTRGQFAVPDAPAFSLIDGAPDEILRPTSVTELTVLASRLVTSDGRFALPRSLGVEASPGLLIGGKRLTIEQYQKSRFLYRLRVSLAVHRAGDLRDATGVAVGARLALLDGADLRTNEQYLQKVSEITARMVRSIASEEEKPAEGDESGVIVSPEALSPQYEALEESLRTLQDEKSEECWNKPGMEMAVAVLGSSPDSTGKNLRANTVAIWITYSHPLSSFGQVLVGATGRAERGIDDVFRGEGSSALRAYIGTNRYKASLDAKVLLKDGARPRWSLDFSSEAYAAHGLWLVLSAGAEYDTAANESELATRASFRYGLTSL